MTALLNLRAAESACSQAAKALAKAHRAFGRHIASSRRISRAAFAKKLGVTRSMLGLMEAGERRWPIARAELAVKLLTRREDWPD